MHFNPRSREGSDGKHRLDTLNPGNFNPRSREGSDVLMKQIAGEPWHFNPRSREGSDIFSTFNIRKSIISIHAPARGATLPPYITVYIWKHFNPRSREGSDLPLFQNTYKHTHFNPRSREGSDFFCSFSFLLSLSFQSTLPRGERQPGSALEQYVYGISIHAPARGATKMRDSTVVTL